MKKVIRGEPEPEGIRLDALDALTKRTSVPVQVRCTSIWRESPELYTSETPSATKVAKVGTSDLGANHTQIPV